MTTTIDRPPTGAAGSRSSGARTTHRRVLAAEALKLRSTRSIRWLLVASVLSILAAALSSALTATLAEAPPPEGAGAATDPLGAALSGVSFTQVLVGVLGILVVTSEYTTGLVRVTFTAVPKRLPVLEAKAVLTGAVVFVVMLAAELISFLGAQAIMSTEVSVSLGNPGVARAIGGSALYLAVTAVLAVAFGWLLRSAIGATGGLFGLLFVVPLIGVLLPAADPYLPTNAGSAIMQIGSSDGVLSPWAGMGVFVLYAAIALGAAAMVLTRRDA